MSQPRDRPAPQRLVAGLLVLAALIAFPTAARGAPDDCLDETTLEALVECVRGFMQRDDEESYVVPDADDLAAVRTVLTAMLGGACGAIALPAELSGHYTVAPFTDADDARTYCVLLETTDAGDDGRVDRGWGTYIVYDGAARNLAIDVPHPRRETNTPAEGIYIFKRVDARAFLMAGAHRWTNSVASPCQASYEIADAAHNDVHPYHAALEAVDAYFDGEGETFTSIQFHGMADATCPDVDVYLTHGSTSAPDPADPVVALRDAFVAAVPAGWDLAVHVPGESNTCSLNGTDNVQGRLINGVDAADVCDTQASGYVGRFIHIEQIGAVRQDSVYAYWVDAINATTLPVVLTTFDAVVDGTAVRLEWTTASETGNAGFGVETAVGAAGDAPWVHRAFVPGRGTASAGARYTHRLDGLAPGRHRVRLRQVDFDGRAAIGPVSVVRISLDAPLHLSAPYPHPASGTVHVTLTARRSVSVRLSIYDAAGRHVADAYAGAPSAETPVDVAIDTRGWAAGRYALRAVTEGHDVERALLVVR